MENTKPHAALLASSGMGHLIPILELGKHLVTLHGFEVTIFIVATDPSTTKSQLLEKTPNSYESYPLHILLLPYKDITSLLDPSANIVVRIAIIMRESLPSLRSAITAMKILPKVLIVDIFGTEAFEIAQQFGM